MDGMDQETQTQTEAPDYTPQEWDVFADVFNGVEYTIYAVYPDDGEVTLKNSITGQIAPEPISELRKAVLGEPALFEPVRIGNAVFD